MSQSVKIILGAVILAILVVGGYIYMTKEEVTSLPPKTTQQEVPKTTKAQEATETPVSMPAPVETQKKLDELQAQLSAGTITPEEAIKQMDAFNAEQAKKVQTPEMK